MSETQFRLFGMPFYLKKRTFYSTQTISILIANRKTIMLQSDRSYQNTKNLTHNVDSFNFAKRIFSPTFFANKNNVYTTRTIPLTNVTLDLFNPNLNTNQNKQIYSYFLFLERIISTFFNCKKLFAKENFRAKKNSKSQPILVL